MSRLARALRRLRANDQGVAAVEFALIAMPLMLFLAAGFDLGWRSFAQSVLVGELDRAARASETGNYTNTQLDAMVTQGLKDFMIHSTITITRKSYQDFSHARPETLTFDANANGTWQTGDCYIDANNNNQWDADLGRSGGGGAQDVVLYGVDMSYPAVIPLTQLIGAPAIETIGSSTLVRNQPYATQTGYNYQDSSTPKCA